MADEKSKGRKWWERPEPEPEPEKPAELWRMRGRMLAG